MADSNNRKPTNSDIYQKLGSIEQITLATKKQAEKTNGRVTKLENWQSGVLAVEVERSKHKPEGVDYTKIILYALGLVGTALSIVAVAIK